MKTKERRKAIAVWLMAEHDAVSGDAIAARFAVSRQTAVKDIAALRDMGYEIISTHNGYILQRSPHVLRVFKVKHETAQTRDELSSIVSLGGTVVDVYVWHKVYGKLTAPLNIYTLSQVDEFIEGVRSGKSVELMHITGGYHYHTVRADSEERLDRIGEMLAAKGYTVPEKE